MLPWLGGTAGTADLERRASDVVLWGLRCGGRFVVGLFFVVIVLKTPIFKRVVKPAGNVVAGFFVGWFVYRQVFD